MMHTPDAPDLIADVGGTNTRVALAHGAKVTADGVRRYRNAEFDSLPDVLSRYLADLGGARPGRVCVAVAGPVSGGTGRLTNLDWTVDGAALRAATGAATATVLNDLQAQGYALGSLSAESVLPVIDGPSAPDAAKLVVGVGTGFNAAPVQPSPGGWIVPPGEAGHISLPIRDADDLALARAVAAAPGVPSVEDVLSGRGITNVYKALQGDGGQPPTSADIMESHDTDPVAARAIAIFTTMLGRAVGDLALVHLPFGGIYLVGGVSRAMAPHLTPAFAAAFRDKGRFATFMEQFAVHLVDDDYAALTGCAAFLCGDGVEMAQG